jgi:hypothetical protein
MTIDEFHITKTIDNTIDHSRYLPTRFPRTEKNITVNNATINAYGIFQGKVKGHGIEGNISSVSWTPRLCDVQNTEYSVQITEHAPIINKKNLKIKTTKPPKKISLETTSDTTNPLKLPLALIKKLQQELGDNYVDEIIKEKNLIINTTLKVKYEYRKSRRGTELNKYLSYVYIQFTLDDKTIGSEVSTDTFETGKTRDTVWINRTDGDSPIDLAEDNDRFQGNWTPDRDFKSHKHDGVFKYNHNDYDNQLVRTDEFQTKSAIDTINAFNDMFTNHKAIDLIEDETPTDHPIESEWYFAQLIPKSMPSTNPGDPYILSENNEFRYTYNIAFPSVGQTTSEADPVASPSIFNSPIIDDVTIIYLLHQHVFCDRY